MRVPCSPAGDASTPRGWLRDVALLALAAAIALILGMAAASAQKVPGGGLNETPPSDPPAPDTAPEPDAAPVPEPQPDTAPAPNPVAGDTGAILDRRQAELEAILGAETVVAARASLADNAGLDAATLGHLMVANRQLDAAAWFLAEQLRATPGNPEDLNNFGVALLERALRAEDDAAARQALLDDAMTLLSAAHTAAPDEPGIAANQGHALLRRGGAGDLDQAIALLEGAAAAMPEDGLTLAHLAEAYALAGRMDAAADVLARMRAIDSSHPAIIAVGQRHPGAMTGPSGAASQCQVDYACPTNCDPSIIGRVNMVTCEIEQSSAQMACEAGQPYAESFDCEGGFSNWGFSIPGLESSLGIRTPWINVDAALRGDGSVDWRVTAGPRLPGGWGPYVSAQGDWDPHSGFSVTETDSGVRINVFPTRGPISQTLADTGRPPIQVQSGSGGTQINSLGGAIWRS